MPPLRAQEVLPNGVRLTTSRFGVVEATVAMVGTTANITVTQDGVTKLTAAMPNATPASVEGAINNWLAANLALTVGGVSVPTMNSAVHVFSLSPFSMTIISTNADTPIAANWWM